jgi:hypothetical protein
MQKATDAYRDAAIEWAKHQPEKVVEYKVFW